MRLRNWLRGADEDRELAEFLFACGLVLGIGLTAILSGLVGLL